ncbi:hypothetical protein [Capnocytophaga stomatis]|uniref:Uncharacterized protein n=1 Tax=Capnocytophaga stomatis TaxID=1848904 RepID=A0ABW8QDW2_9FLAO
MKKIILLAITAISLIGCNSNKENNDWKRDNLKGRVKSINIRFYEAIEKFGQIEKGERFEQDELNKFTRYNKEGNKEEEIFYNRDESLKGTVKYKYDNKGNTSELIFYFNDGTSLLGTKYKYDEKGNKIEENNYQTDGEIDSKVTFLYDNKNNLIEKNEYMSDGSLKYRWKYTYNKGFNTEIKVYGSNGDFRGQMTFSYNEKGDVLEENQKGKNYEMRMVYKDYDLHSNWTRQIWYEKGKPKGIVEREIQYYE